MGTDLFIHYSCPFRKDGEALQLQHLLKLKRYLDRMDADAQPSGTVRVMVREAAGPTERVYTKADLKMAAAKLAEVYPICDGCPANLKKAFGIRGSVGCHAHVARPLDDFAERILHETLVENAREERRDSEQSNLLRALVAARNNGDAWRTATPDSPARSGGGNWGRQPVAVALDAGQYEVNVHGLLELLFMFPTFPLRAVDDILSFFRSFFAVVGGYVSTPDGKLDQRRNERFWRQSPALNELNLYIQLLKHCARLGRGVVVVPD